MQGIQIQEGVRVQQGEALGRQFAFNAQEQRESGKINYTRNQITGAQQRETNAYNQGTNAMMGAIGGLTQLGSIGAAGLAAGKGNFSQGAQDYLNPVKRTKVVP